MDRQESDHYYYHQQQKSFPHGTYSSPQYSSFSYAEQPLPQPTDQDGNFQYAALQSRKREASTNKSHDVSSTNRGRTWKQKMSGWRFGAILFAIAALIVLVANVCIAIYAVRESGASATADFKPIYTGDCARTKALNTWLHLTINVLSSILLSGSNYCMQVLSAPSRKNVDEAHAARKWLDIGIPSLRNLRVMTPKRRALWVLILITSAPLHLVYNSIFSQSWTRQAYEAALVTPDFLAGAPFDAGYTEYSTAREGGRRLFGEIQANSSTYQRLEPMECIKAYNKKAILDRKTVLVVTSLKTRPLLSTSYGPDSPARLDDGSTNPVFAVEDFVGNEVGTGTWNWMCDNLYDYSSDEGCDLTDVLSGNKEWSPFMPGVKVEYCLSEYLGEQCALDFSFGLMMVVCVCNLIKLSCMVTLCFSSGTTPLLNIGDAVSSFLDAEDVTTRGMCLAGKKEIKQYWDKREGYTPVEPLTWTRTSMRWFRACSTWRWAVFALLSSASIITSIVLLGLGLSNSRSGGLKSWSFGVASIYDGSPYVITYGHELYQPHRLVANILLANLPQLVISFLFLAYNSILTSMVMAKEWSDFAHERKTLRVSAPVGKQRSTYYLQLPYRYAIPLLLSSMLLHWVTSQAIFLDRRIVLQVWWGEPYEDNDVGSVSTVGYSPVAAIICLLIGVSMLVALVFVALGRYKPGIPLAASCSAAISAACHLERNEPDAAVLPLLWGVAASEQWDRIGHCAFSSLGVREPVDGNRYA
ncbi:uncharacterized protein PV09_04041 [Verruconis gallopava]|uniref:DUF6536 domain-containing protein n=1 Tax=Verruconis gallopava TaxID=253628 RepID=A0A0D2B0G6_9PEZI|nr:uncharacterized protein PV09_04041 [Verruconis gallopava]KIW04859.1 hypothetical protein PV09_04041 [Verruconis gallopava]